MKNKALFILISILLCFGAAHLDLMAYQDQEDRQELEHEVTVVLKLIQVYVLDNDDKPVFDLDKSDFELYEDGQLKPITDFERHILTLQREGLEKQKVQPRTEPTFGIYSRMNRKFFLLLDYDNNDGGGISKSKSAAIHFIESKLQPADEVGVISYSLETGMVFHQYLCADHASVCQAIKELKILPGGNKGEDILMSMQPRSLAAPMPTSPFQEEAKIEVEVAKAKIRSFSAAMRELATSLRYLPGYKSLILFSAGIPRYILHDAADSGIRDKFEDMGRELGAASTALFAVNTDGAREHLKKQRGELGDHSLMKLSDLSGGKYFADVTHYESIAQEIQAITGNYYILGYYIHEKWDGKFHEIKVKVKRKDCRVIAQGGYFNPKPFWEFSEFEKQLHFLDLALNDNPYSQSPLDFPLRVLTCFSQQDTGLIILSELSQAKMREVIGPDTELAVLILDKSQNVVNSSQGKIDFSSVPDSCVYPYAIFFIPPGEYDCRLVLRNLKTGRAAVAASAAVLPEGQEGMPLISPLLLVPGKRAAFMKVSKSSGQKAPLSLNRIYPFVSNRNAPLLEELTLGTSKLLAVVPCVMKNIPESQIQFAAYLIRQPSGEKVILPCSFLTSEKSREKQDCTLLELSLPVLSSGRYSLYLVAEGPGTESQSIHKQDFFIH